MRQWIGVLTRMIQQGQKALTARRGAWRLPPRPRSAAFRLQKSRITRRRSPVLPFLGVPTLLQPEGCAPGAWRHCPDARLSRRVRARDLWVCAMLGLLLIRGMVAAAAPAPLSAPVKAWLAAQTTLQTWSADFVQTRTLQSLTEPLTAKGHVWFEAPERFRWELGQPPETIAVCARTNLLLIYPRLKRVERIPLAGNQTGPWRDALAMLEAGFPRSEAALRDRYEVLSQVVTNQTCRLVLRPRSAAARRMMPRIEIDFDIKDHLLRGTELEFSDGSTLRNDFDHIVLNPKLAETMFAPPIPADYTVVEPLRRQ